MKPLKTDHVWFVAAFLTVAVLFTSCSVESATDLTKHCIIPVPESVTATHGAFALRSPVRVAVSGRSADIEALAALLAGDLSGLTGMESEVLPAGKRKRRGRIYLEITEDQGVFPPEGYRLMVTDKEVKLQAGDLAGIYRAYQTLRQTLAFNNCSIYEPQGEWFIPTGVIVDQPGYAYRGTMLDVSRHFFSVDEVKRYIDLIALYKLNVLHLHLSDDQGWRIEIRSWPKLTEIGGSTEVGGGEGGYYTQEQYQEIVAYAAERYITVVPEIDMPGHTNAALASYAELNCDGEATELYTGTRVGFSSLCTDKAITYQFVGDVIREVAALTPGPYIHIGGDESHSTDIKDYIEFIERVQEIVRANGKVMLGWDEISHAELDSASVAQYWAHAENAQRAVEQGCRVIMSPAERCYLDMKYDTATVLGLKWAGYIGLDKAYGWNPETMVPGISGRDILGVESPLWSETVTTIGEIEQMAFPRLIAHAEIGWSRPDLRDWDDYLQRLAHHGMMLDKLGVNYYRSPLVDWEEEEGDGVPGV
jgi:hexosaminidase